MTLNAGVRFDRYSSWLPEQGNPGTGPFAASQHLSRDPRLPGLQRLVAAPLADLRPDRQRPRRAQGELRPLCGVGLGRHRRQRSGGCVGQSGGDAAPRPTAGTARIPYIAERGRSAVGHRRRRAASAARSEPRRPRAWTNSPAASISAVTRDLTVRINVVRKLDWGGNKELDLAQPFEAFTDRVTGVDPGRDNIAGTADDGVVRCGRCRARYPTFGQISSFTTNTAPTAKARIRYWAFETTASKRYANGWSLLGVVFVGSPRRQKHRCRATRTRAYGASTTGCGQAAADLPGRPLERHLRAAVGDAGGVDVHRAAGRVLPASCRSASALNTLVNVVVEGQAGRYDWVKLMDCRLSKTVRFGKTLVRRHVRRVQPDQLERRAAARDDQRS